VFACWPVSYICKCDANGERRSGPENDWPLNRQSLPLCQGYFLWGSVVCPMGPVVVHGLDDGSTALWLWQKIIIHRLYNDDVAAAVAVAVAVDARVNYGPLDCTRGVYYHISGRRRQRHQPSS